jgi:integrase
MAAMSPRRSPGDGHVFKRADGMWIGGVELPTTDGKRRQKRVSSKSRNDCLRKKRELEAAIKAGIVVGTGKVKVGNYLDDWLEKVHKYRCKPSTFPGDVRTARLYIKPHIGGKRLDQLTPVEVRDMIDTLRQDSPRKAEKAYQLLRSALDQAVKDGMVMRNVVDAVDRPRHKAEVHPAFTPTQSLHIIRTAEVSCDETGAARWAAGFMTGLRESELLGLEWHRVDLSNDLLDVSWQLQQLQKSHGCGDPDDAGKYPCGKVRMSFCPQAHWKFNDDLEYRLCVGNSVWTPPKSQRSDRGVPIIAPLHLILARLKEADTGPNPHNLVFHHPDGSPITQSQDQKAWKRLLELAKVPHAPQHTLRRTAASLLRAAQVDEQTRMDLFGHASADVQRIYAGSDLELLRAGMEKLAEILA